MGVACEQALLRSRVLARLVSLAQIGELARRLKWELTVFHKAQLLKLDGQVESVFNHLRVERAELKHSTEN